ncbi:enediyne antibiotic chromoprotein [Amycolatopsis sp. cg13]|uniref:enediyne antibiotic chromoprotein n=1 Tax=Amycolatopsis sp. cg13 TaxID=3238807 RepID=UPI0035236EF7
MNLIGRRIAFGASICAFSLGLTALGQSVSSADPLAGPQAVTATPSTGLNSGDTVSYTASGFTGNEQVRVGECSPTGTEVVCAQATSQHVTTDANGGLTGKLVVTKTFQGVKADGSPYGLVDCAVSVCGVAVTNDSFNEQAAAVISFN